MDPRDRADAILARARARGAFVVTPDSATSPMDAAATLQIPRAVMAAIDAADPDVTMVFPVSGIAALADPEDDLPAIAREAATQSLASPPRPRPVAGPGSGSGAQGRGGEPEQVGGLIPTVKQPQQPRQSMTQRLDGDF
ncbi:hypothetical protein [Actinokineospora bangkokensis]|uniref:Uncharacterized protein n=1 Tax=Actinokineospora bangkokensis TaxID=1193682 RepID=A0A1Q9LEI2_9PSEU|nr:hypothetical protein [Actinokineospora bangkokensis]OLR90436.1 hypothetical protein BJP25_27715 [Actinokineospora bangkokensis]